MEQPNPQPNDPRQDELDRIEAEAAAMSAGRQPEGGATIDNDTGKPLPEPEPAAASAGPEAYYMTCDLVAGDVKFACAKYLRDKIPRPDHVTPERYEVILSNAVTIFDRPMFRDIVVPVLVKWNISLTRLGAELTMIGGLWFMVQEMVQTIEQEFNKAAAEAKTA